MTGRLEAVTDTAAAIVTEHGDRVVLDRGMLTKVDREFVIGVELASAR